MRRLAAGILVSAVCSAPLLAQERDSAMARISLALQQPSPLVLGGAPVEGPRPRKLGIVTLLPPATPGEVVRVSIPIGALVTQVFRGVAAANHRRQEAAVRRRIEAELKRLSEQ